MATPDRTMKPVDVVLVGYGWTASIMAAELTEAGLDVLALERGPDQNTVPDFQYPKIADELAYALRYKLAQRPAHSTVTIRHGLNDTALPYRRLGSFLPGNGVGGAGVHWNGHTWRPQPQELRLRSYVVERFGRDAIPEGMTIQDFGVSYEELEPHFDFAEKMMGIAGKAGNLGGERRDGGNVFEGPRQNEYPLPPLEQLYNGKVFEAGARELGWHPFPLPSANASRAYTNPYGMQLGPCNFCGFCERFGCLNYSKASPQVCINDMLARRDNFEYRVHAEVTKVELDNAGRRATGVTYVDADNRTVFQPASLVILCAYQLHNVWLLLVSGIGKAYDPVKNTGVVGRNYAYQMNGGATLFFKEKLFNPFIGAGASGTTINDFGVEQIDFGREGFIGGSYITSNQTNGQPIRSISLPGGTPTWGAKWKAAIREHYGHSMSVSSHGSNMSYRDCYLSLDPNYRTPHGQPLLRMTFDWKHNDLVMTQFMRKRIEEVVKVLSPDSVSYGFKKDGDHYDVRPYQTTHNVGGTVMGADPSRSVVNRYLQSWDVHNVFVMGAGGDGEPVRHDLQHEHHARPGPGHRPLYRRRVRGGGSSRHRSGRHTALSSDALHLVRRHR